MGKSGFGATATGKFRTVNDLLSILRKKLPGMGGDPKTSREAFKRIDTNGNGSVSEEEFRCLFGLWGMDITEDEAASFFRRVDTNSDGELEYDSFIEQLFRPDAKEGKVMLASAAQADAALKKRMEIKYGSLREAFLAMDIDTNGILDAKELRVAADKAGVSISNSQAAKLLSLYDTDGDGKISVVEFMERIGQTAPQVEIKQARARASSMGTALFANIVKQIQHKIQSKTSGGGMAARKAFKMFDQDSSGTVDQFEMRAVLRNWAINITPEQTQAFMRYIDKDCGGELNYNRFVASVVDGATSASAKLNSGMAKDADRAFKKKISHTFKSLTQAFRHYDEDHNGYIDLNELIRGASRGGVELSTNEARKLMLKYTGQRSAEHLSMTDFMKHFGNELNASETNGVSNKLTNSKRQRFPKSKMTELNNEQIIALIREKMNSVTSGGSMQARKAFKMFDKDGSGSIDVHEMKQVLENWGIPINHGQVVSLMRLLDNDGSGEIDYNEFIDSVMNEGTASLALGNGTADQADQALKRRVVSGFTKLREAFLHLDTDHNGYIDLKELHQAALNAGVRLSKTELKKLMDMYDPTGENKITNKMFTAQMGSLLNGTEGAQAISNQLISSAGTARRSRKKSLQGFNQAFFGKPETDHMIKGKYKRSPSFESPQTALNGDDIRRKLCKKVQELSDAFILFAFDHEIRQLREIELMKAAKYVGIPLSSVEAMKVLSLYPKVSQAGFIPAMQQDQRGPKKKTNGEKQPVSSSIAVHGVSQSAPASTDPLPDTIKKYLSQKRQFKNLFKAFQYVDDGNTGEVTEPGFKRALEMCGINPPAFELGQLWEAHERDGCVAYRKFMKHFMVTLKLKESTQRPISRRCEQSKNAWKPVVLTKKDGPRARAQARAQAESPSRQWAIGRRPPQRFMQPVRPPGNQQQRAFYGRQRNQIQQVVAKTNTLRWTQAPVQQRRVRIDPGLKIQVAARWKSVRKACVYIDAARTGCIPAEAMHRILDSFGIDATIADVAELPTKQVGPERLVAYNVFVKACLQNT